MSVSHLLMLLAAALGSLALGWLLGFVLTRARWAMRAAAQQAGAAQLLSENSALKQQLAQAEQHKQESLELLRASFEEQQKTSLAQFATLSAKVLEANTNQLKSSNTEHMSALLSPLKAKLEDLNRTVQQANTTNASNKASFEGLIKQMLDQTKRLDEEAANLTRALKGDSKKQGDWGELILERMLEESGLKKDEEYYIQQAVRTEDGRLLRPDVVVRFPDQRSVVIDSKVSLTAYAAFAAAEDEAARQAHLAAHVASVRKHIDELSAKDYSSVVQESVGYVLMFIPNEASYIAAVQAAPELPLEGYRKRVLLISPTNLLMALQLAYNLWQKERQTRNVEAIFKKAAAIYDKCAGLADSFADVGKNLKKALDSHDEAMRRFNSGKGNLTRQVEDLRQMGISPSKRLSLTDDEET